MADRPLTVRQPVAAFAAWTALLLSSRIAVAVDWPCYRADACRSGVTAERIEFPLASSWQYRAAARPQPAWPEPGRTLHLMDFDYAFQPVAAGGLVLFASSTDDSVRALDERTGTQRWRFTARGPIRFAPQIADGRCYFAGDDGYVYCLEASTGQLVWEFRAAPDGRMAIGNERMISRSPCRSGVLVAGGVAYVTAGMWPAEGVSVYAIDAASGKVLWCNDTNSALYLGHPHASASFGGPAPQGYLAASADVLLVPTGQAMPAGFDRRTGKLLYCHVTPGGARATIVGDVFFTDRIRMENQDRDVVQVGENGPVDGDGLEVHRLATGEPHWDLAEGLRTLGGRSGKPGEGIRYGLVNRQHVLWRDRVLYAVGGGTVEAIDCSDPARLRRMWTVEHARAYCAVLTADALLVGGAGTITALATDDGRQVWRAAADGQVRGLAVANGQVIAATEKGTIATFARRASQSPPAHPSPAAAEKTLPTVTGSVSRAAEVLAAIPHAARLRGYALVIGESDARLAEELARRTPLHVLCVLDDLAKVSAERDRLLRHTDLYGRRVAIHHIRCGDTLPYTPYFANAVVVCGKAAGVSGEELYRVLRPCGGRIIYLGGTKAENARRLAAAKVPPAEIVSQGDSLTVVRGKLPGAFDWDSAVACDQRVRWPLELLWFGGPGPARMVARHWKAPTPVFANGRYFALGQFHLIAVDAYNGCELWSRQIGGNSGYKIMKIAADDDRVYLNFPDYVAEFDAGTGDLRKLYGRPKPSPRLTLDEPRATPMVHGLDRLGAVSIARTAEAVEVTLGLDAAESSANDAWQLHFDFRPLDKQFADAGPGAFRLEVTPDGSWRPGLGGPLPPLSVRKKPSAKGRAVVVAVPWAAIGDLVGERPATFRLAATLRHAEPRRPEARIHAFADGMTTFVNDGWATFVVDEAAARPAAEAALPVPVGKPEDLPAYARDWPRQPRQYTAEWTIDAYDKLELRHWPPLARDSIPATRFQPLTGKVGERTYTRSHGCGGTVSSAAADFFRSGTLGIYDRLDDSGLRNFAAIRPGCGMTLVPAGGLLLSSEGQADCTCSFNFQTSFAMAPAAARRNEDWALFDAPLGTSLIRGAALNLGAPGDRRDEQGLLWLGYPRPAFAVAKGAPSGKSRKYTFDVPCELEFHDGFGPYRVNADRRTIQGTDRPWIYASGCLGLKKATLNLLYGEREELLATETSQPPKIDGRLDDACWQGVTSLELPEQKTEISLRYDAERLYIAAKRRGTSALRDDSPALQIALREDGEPKFARLDVAGDGRRRSTRWHSALAIPRLERIAIDGKSDDWKNAGYPLSLPGGGACRLGWNDDGIAMLVDLPAGFSAQGTDLTGLLAMFVDPQSKSFLQLATDAKAQTHSLDHRVRKDAAPPYPPVARNVSGLMHWGHPFGELVSPGAAFRAAETKTAERLVVEVLFPWPALRCEPAVGREIPLHIALFDPQKVDPKFAKGGDWRPQVLADAKMLGRVRLAEKPGAAAARTALVNQRHGPTLALLVQEDGGWEPAWSSAVEVEGDIRHVEAAIPWKILAEAGIHKDRLKVGFGGAAKPAGTVRQVSDEFDRSAHRVAWERPVAANRLYTVRLHFCETADVRPGERVFDVRLQGKVVLGGLDVVREAGAANAAVVKEFRGVVAEKSICLELVPKSPTVEDRNAPILSGIELFEE